MGLCYDQCTPPSESERDVLLGAITKNTIRICEALVEEKEGAVFEEVEYRVVAKEAKMDPFPACGCSWRDFDTNSQNPGWCGSNLHYKERLVQKMHNIYVILRWDGHMQDGKPKLSRRIEDSDEMKESSSYERPCYWRW